MSKSSSFLQFCIHIIFRQVRSSEFASSVQFDYAGDRDNPGDRLNPGEALTFDFIFSDGFSSSDTLFAMWTDTASSLGKGIGGGDEFGQVAVSFQRLGINDDSDLVTSDWTAAPVPEPATMFLLGSGMLGLAGIRKKIEK